MHVLCALQDHGVQAAIAPPGRCRNGCHQVCWQASQIARQARVKEMPNVPGYPHYNVDFHENNNREGGYP